MWGGRPEAAFTSVIDIRTTDAASICEKKRAEFRRMQKRFALAEQYTREEQAEIQSVLERVKK